jgi:hypothetical protein
MLGIQIFKNLACHHANYILHKKGGGETNDMWGWKASPPQGKQKNKIFFCPF